MDEKPGADTGATAPDNRGSDEEESRRVEQGLMRVAEMFSPHRDDPLMRELCRLAVKCVQERWIGG